jgi:vacuolar-type H+-ATPase subunit E/Vma4
MAYENLLKSVEESATERERELREKARVAIEEIEAHSRKQAEEVQQSYLSGAEKSAEVEKNKLLYLTKGENKELIITIKEKIFSSAFHEAGQQLSAVRERPGYLKNWYMRPSGLSGRTGSPSISTNGTRNSSKEHSLPWGSPVKYSPIWNVQEVSW